MSHATPRQRVLDALAHQQPDRIPVDVGGSNMTTIVDTTYARLKARLGVEAEPRYFSRRARQAVLDEAVLVRLGSCARPLHLRPPDHAGSTRPDGTIVDEWGVGWVAAGGHYIPVECPLSGADAADLNAYPFPDPDDPGRFRGLREAARALRADGQFASVLSLNVSVVHLSQWLRGFDEYLMDLAADEHFASLLMGRVMEVHLALVENAVREVGHDVDAVLFGDDLGFQDRPMVRPEVYRRLIKPHHRAAIELIKRHTGAAVVFHTCGAIRDLIPDLIEIGVDAITPVQVSASGMQDTALLKREFGADLTFWGGIDTQHVLPHGSPADVRDEVARRIADLAPEGGFVLGAVHDIQDDVPVENILAMVDAAAEFGVR
jgi:uroporphyrinogen decarboxylase